MAFFILFTASAGTGIIPTHFCLYPHRLLFGRSFPRGPLDVRFFRCGNSVFLVFEPDKTSEPGGDVPTHGAHGPGHIAFAMKHDEIPAWREQLQRNGVEIEQEVSWPSGGYSLYFRDPAGNSVELATPQIWGLSAD